MKYRQTISTTLFYILISVTFFCSGCSVFSAIGHAISQGYENTVTYFNIYYNAKRLFDKAEDEIIADSLKARTNLESTPGSTQASAGAKQKLGPVIDKCSNILALHPSSTLVDDALLLLGKSFFYESEYLKAERKFEELISQYPDGPLLLEAQLWYARTEEKLGNLDLCFRLTDDLINSAKAAGEDETELQGRQLLAVYYTKTDQNDKAIGEYEQIKKMTSDKDIRTEANINSGDIYLADSQYEKAVGAYLNSGKYSSDVYTNYYRMLHAAIAYRNLGEFEKGMKLLNFMADDFRYKEYIPAVLYERANNYSASGRYTDAANDYVLIDTEYVKTTYAVRSAYRLGLLYENKYTDYGTALKYYSEVNSSANRDIEPEGRLKYKALVTYFNSMEMLKSADSVIAFLKDTTLRRPDSLSADTSQKQLEEISDNADRTVKDTPEKDVNVQDRNKSGRRHVPFQGDMAKNDSSDNRGAQRDSSNLSAAKRTFTNLPKNIDTLKMMKAVAAQDLGDVFYSEIKIPDSAYYWYNRSLDFSYNAILSPRILYLMGEISRTYPEKKFSPPEEYYRQLERDFPGSIYAEEARRLLGKEPALVKKDTAAEYYRAAEKMIDEKQYSKAVETLKKIVRLYPNSTLAAKSEFAIGWIAEYCLYKPDTAIAYYRIVKERYAGTKFAAEASRKALEIERQDTLGRGNVGADSVSSMRLEDRRGIHNRGQKDTSAVKVTEPVVEPAEGQKGILNRDRKLVPDSAGMNMNDRDR